MSTRIPSFTRYQVAAIQYEPTFGEKEKNIRDLLGLVEEAIQHDARLIVLPEMATTGYCWASRAEIAPYMEPIPGPTTERFQQLASRYGCYIAVSLPEVDAATQVYYNSMALLGPDGLVGTYRKIHSYISEPRWARDGDLGIPVWDTPLGKLSGLICMDIEYFETSRIAALRGADVLLFPANWDNEKSPSSWWMARAFENGVYVIAANRYGRERGVQFSGGSSIIDPDGTIQSYLDNGQGIVYGEVDLTRCRDKRWRRGDEVVGYPLADRQPAEYTTLVQNTYLWEPLRYHGLYGLGELPTGQLSCVGIVQMDLEALQIPQRTHEETIQALGDLLRTSMQDNAPACPDVLVLPELLLPGPVPGSRGVVDMSGNQVTAEEMAAHFREGAIRVPGPETAALVALADELQLSLVVGVAERGDDEKYYNTVLLIDPEGVYGSYRKLHLTQRDRLWASPGNLGLPTFDTPAGRIGLVTGYDALFPETLRVLAGLGTDLVCASTMLDFPDPIGLAPTTIPYSLYVAPDGYDPTHFLIWRVRAAEHNVYLALANWYGERAGVRANGLSGIFSPTYSTYPWPEVIADDEPGLVMMTIDTREQRTGRRTSRLLEYSPGDMVGSLTGELAYNILDSIPGNVVRSKPLLRKRQPFWYLDLVKREVV
ncbi:MAG TPA: nitrilase-related carbon-nitrogen hydrolase [Ktedonobacteraceae bacterium]|nr:nitrilase-related carbon-nitrogen hydrolase [Ktedonobacteraceae bacterium]